ncbi:rod shape-determining protein MreD [uncultured Croceitalea sp.]|uniref:rod shape-determining protein MreD n=1 Tax=uncultured Croceitalea sp. TaxID=1798908 RepID=UPI0033056AA4
MLNNPAILTVVRFVLLLLAQVLIFNHLNFFGFINPLVYVLFFYWYPIRENRAVFILVSFLFGICVDIFSDTLALHTVASITLAYGRPIIMRFCFGANFDFQGFTFKNSTRIQRVTFLALLILTQQIVFFSLEMLSFAHILLILKKILFTTIATFIISLLLSSLFAVENE